MRGGKGKHQMDNSEIKELMKLKEWSRMDLAVHLGITENAVQQWFSKKGDKRPSSTACILMRIWLDECKQGAMAS